MLGSEERFDEVLGCGSAWYALASRCYHLVRDIYDIELVILGGKRKRYSLRIDSLNLATHTNHI